MLVKKAILLFGSLVVCASLQAKDYQQDFESVKAGSIPKVWKVVSLWEVQKFKGAPSGEKVFSMKDNKKGFLGFGSGFNLAFTKAISFKDGEIGVKFHANSGRIDQGGGIIWRVQDKDNYYVARFNPLEDNFRFYKVIDGSRSELKSADIKLSKGWHSMKIIQKGDHFEGYLDGQKLLDADDKSIRQSGGAGLWTKADAKTSFDDFVVKSEK